MNKNDVGSNAGKIWHLLAERGNMSIRKIGEMTHCRESVIFLALGWLARENKIRFRSDGGDMLFVEINVPLTETYY